jgi:uncharacterized protein (TIGR02646 family)
MRHINPERVYEKISKEWHAKAAAALEQIRRLTPEERSQEIENLSHIWKALKNELHAVSNGKCWYCETRDVRHDDEIDHWRPKNAVYECEEHQGYWWLAFSWENFRYACVYCNQKRVRDKSGQPDKGGKGTSFPLLDKSKRIFDECYRLDLLQEKPLLLDPMVKSDTRLLQFDVDGTAYPAKKEPSVEYQRADESIKIYHLNAHDLTEKRRTMVCNQVERLLQDGQGFCYCLEKSDNDVAALAGFSRVLNQLSRMLDAEAEYSMAAKSVLRFYRKQYPWVEEVLDEVAAS